MNVHASIQLTKNVCLKIHFNVNVFIRVRFIEMEIGV